MQRAMDAGDIDLYVDCARAGRGIAYGIARDPGIHSYTRAMTLDALVMQQITRDVIERRIDGDTLAELSELYERDALLPPEFFVRAEFLKQAAHYGERIKNDDVFLDFVLRYFLEGLEAMADDPERASAARTKLRDLETADVDWYWRPNLRGFSWPVEAYRARLRGMRLLLAIERYRLRHDGFPGALDDLVPEYLDELPRDPSTGGEFGYRRIDPEQDELGREYLLYAAGYDRTDNGGTSHPRSNNTAISESADRDGHDFVINHIER